MKTPITLLLITVLWLITIFIINPLGEFPLNDDWSYAKSVLILYEQGKMTIDYWAAMTLVAQISWGTLFCKIFGFSFLTLRISTLVIALLGLLAFYQIALSISLNKKLALFASLVLCFNPLFLSLSFTFMTDVHFFSLSIISILFYLKYTEEKKILYILLATIFSIITALIRQPGIIFPLAYMLCMFYKNRNMMTLIKSFIPFLLTLFALLLHSLWLQSTGYGEGVVGIQGALMSLSWLLDIYHVLVRLSYCVLYSGIFLLPLSMLYWKNVNQYIVKYKFKLLYAFVPIAVLLLIGGVHYPIPDIGSIVHNLGIGPKTLKDSSFKINISPQLHEQLWIVPMKLISILGSIMVLLLLIRKKEPNDTAELQQQTQQITPQTNTYIWIVIGLYVVLLTINRVFFDRHIILLTALVSLLILSQKIEYTVVHRNIAIGCLVLMSWFSISGTHDYLSWNRARWEAINYLNHELKITPDRIDAGFEYNAWNNAGPYNKPPQKINEKSWWWVTDDEYVISFGDIPGYKKLKAYPYFQLLTFQNGSIFILKRE